MLSRVSNLNKNSHIAYCFEDKLNNLPKPVQYIIAIIISSSPFTFLTTCFKLERTKLSLADTVF